MDFIYRLHATQRMFERDINQDSVEEVIKNGEIIEEYKDDKPYPSCLIFGFDRNRPLHIVYAIDENKNYIIITVYEPNLLKWEDDFKRRKKI